jgi:hypothetical protein
MNPLMYATTEGSLMAAIADCIADRHDDDEPRKWNELTRAKIHEIVNEHEEEIWWWVKMGEIVDQVEQMLEQYI